jgi:transcriptional regulator NrdR family protein
MIPCPKCRKRTDVYDSRINTLGQLRRKRTCRACGWRFATIEVMDTGNKLKQLDELPTPKPKVEKVPKPKREKPVKVKKLKQEKVRRFDEDDFEDDNYQVPEDLRYLISDRGFD